MVGIEKPTVSVKEYEALCRRLHAISESRRELYPDDLSKAALELLKELGLAVAVDDKEGATWVSNPHVD